MIQPFPTLDSLTRQLRVQLPKPFDSWRLVADPVLGHIAGLGQIPSSSFVGHAIATNGVMVLIYDLGAKRHAFGHLEWFEPDASEDHYDLSDLWDDTKRPAKPNKKDKVAKQQSNGKVTRQSRKSKEAFLEVSALA